MPSQDLTVGIDIGTTSVKGVVVDGDGTIVARARLAHSVLIPSPDRIEHDPRVAWRRSPRRILAALGNPVARGIGIAAMGPSLAAVTRTGVPQAPGLIYGDARGGDTANGVGEAVGFLTELAQQHPRAKGFWPAQAVASVSVGGPPTIGSAVASMMRPLWNGSEWDQAVLRACGAQVSQMPMVRPEGEGVGRVGEMVIESGSLDVSCEQLMAGPIGRDEALVLCGGTLVMMMPLLDEREVPGVWTYRTPSGPLATGASNAGALFLDWVDRVIAAGTGPLQPGQVPVWCPYIRGERTPWHDPMRRAALVDLNIAHDGAAIRRAAYEASGFVVRHHLDLSGATPRRIVAVGGGTAVAGWAQALADCTGVPVEMRGSGIGAAMGAAFMARIAAGLEGSIAGASRWVTPGTMVEPDPAWTGPVAARYQRFLELVSDAGEARSEPAAQ